MEVHDFLSQRKDFLFQNTYSSLKDLIPGFIDMYAVPVLKDYKSHIENTPESERLSAEKFLDNHLYQEAFLDFKCYWKMIDLMEEWVKT